MRRRVRRFEGRKKSDKKAKKIPRVEDIFAKKAAVALATVCSLGLALHTSRHASRDKI